MRSLSASSAQRGLWLAQRMSPDTLNHPLFLWDVDGELDTAVMAAAFRHVLAEAEVLRAGFVDDGGELRLVSREPADWQPFLLDLRDAADPEQAAREALADLVRQPFDLERDVLLRLGVVRLAAARSLVVITYHHLVSDGYGAGGLLSRRLADVYTAMVRGTRVPDLPQPWTAEPFAAEAAAYRASPAFAEDTEFWRTYLAGAPAPARIPPPALSEAARSALSEPVSGADRWSEPAGAIGMTSRTLTVARAEADAWTEAAKSMGVWMSSLLAAALAVYLRHRCDRPELLFSLAVGNRAGVASGIPGLAVNVVPVRVRVPLGATFAEIVEAVIDETYAIAGHTAHHYSDIQRVSGAVLSGRSCFGAVLNVVELGEQLHFDGSPARHVSATIGAFDELSVTTYTDGSADSDLFIRLDAPAGLYSRAELRFLGEELIAYLHGLTAAPARPVGAVDVPSTAERDRVPTAPVLAEASVPGVTVPELFARQVSRSPDAVAVVDGNLAVSYRVLDERSSLLAAALRRRQVRAETVVAVAMPRSVDLAVALLAVTKAGAAYLLIDPVLPAARIRSMVAGSSARVLLTGATAAGASLAAPDVPVIPFDDLCQDSDGVPEVPAPPHVDNLVAVKPGSGAATGVEVTHRNLRRLVTDRGPRTVLWHSPHSSDGFALEWWGAVLNGGRVVVAPPGEPDTGTLNRICTANDISAMWLPAGLFSAIAAERPAWLAGLREVWTGGDRVPAAAMRRVRDACPDLTIVVDHGSAETAVLGWPGEDEPAPGTGETALYVLGPGLTPVPAGVAGELYVAGSGVARGYRGRPGLTAERFVPCPFGAPGGLMYRTGDRVRWGTGGRLEHVGRTGGEAEIRGELVEPARIEEVLSEHPGPARSVVVAREDAAGQRRLVAYVVPVRDRSLSEAELRRFATDRLPETMVPSVFEVVESLPETPGGRVDPARLPDPTFDDRRHRAPRDHSEQVLAEAFAEVLELNRVVGIDDDFFDLGGNSLRAIRLVGLIRTTLNVELSIRTLFAARTIAGLSDRWKDLAASSRPALRRRTRDGEML
ncbi:AMP-binding protein [Amycolatopsis oliviviridis]|uniref:Carrier domain-containing protein n=1 Tax=Amycolatopsis oliviviridis TaxID=1471590 RepID=A0ABQ3L3L7_9PSEU|nr:AMP-binding protein [Amycolatopsis oliviviridis]GHH01359.1 hypothetical protein GCM10017790_01240 [Amycolatopsis oliviviridis]